MHGSADWDEELRFLCDEKKRINNHLLHSIFVKVNEVYRCDNMKEGSIKYVDILIKFLFFKLV